MKKLLTVVIGLAFILSPVCASHPAYSQEVLKKPVVHLNFEDNYKDASTDKHDGTKSGKVTFSEGVIGKGAEFSGGYIDLANTDNLDFSKGITLSVWLKLNTADSKISWPILYKEGTEDGWPAMLFHIGYGGTVFQSSLGFGKDYPNYTFDFISNDRIESTQLVEKWTHVVAVFNGKEEKVYIDGELRDAQFVPDEILKYSKQLTKSSRPLRVGKSGEEDFKGYMDELKIFNDTLTEDEIIALYNEVNSKYNGKIELKIDHPTIYVNGAGKPIDSQNDSITPVVIEDRTLVPIRAIIEAIGGTIGWDEKEKRIDISYKSSKMQLWINNKNAKVNGQDMKIDVPPMTISERTMLPLRFVSENLGMKVEWDQNTQSIILKYIK